MRGCARALPRERETQPASIINSAALVQSQSKCANGKPPLGGREWDSILADPFVVTDGRLAGGAASWSCNVVTCCPGERHSIAPSSDQSSLVWLVGASLTEMANSLGAEQAASSGQILSQRTGSVATRLAHDVSGGGGGLGTRGRLSSAARAHKEPPGRARNFSLSPRLPASCWRIPRDVTATRSLAATLANR